MKIRLFELFLCHPSRKIYFFYFLIYLLFLLLFNKYFYTCKCFLWRNKPTYLLQTLFHGILPSTARGLASKTAINWHLKVKDTEHNNGLTKNYCITVSMQKISSIHKLIQQILGSHELNDHTHFCPGPPKKH